MPKLIGKIEITMILSHDPTPPSDEMKEKLDNDAKELARLLEEKGYELIDGDISIGVALTQEEMEQVKAQLLDGITKNLGNNKNDVTYTPDGIPVPKLGKGSQYAN